MNMRNQSILALMGLALFAATPSFGQAIPERKMQQLDAFMLTEAVTSVREAYLVAMRDLRFPECAEAPVYERVVPSRAPRDDFLWAVQFVGHFPRGADAPDLALWTEAYEVTYCGNAVRENANFYILQAGRPLAAEWAPPGDTMADASHVSEIIDAIRRTGTSAISFYGGANCGETFDQKQVVRNTRALSERGDSRTEHHEQWSLEYCDIAEEFEVTFTMSRRGEISFSVVEIESAEASEGE